MAPSALCLIEALDRLNIEDMIILSKSGFSLENLSKCFKIDIDGVVEALARAVGIQPKILRRIMIYTECELPLQEISKDFEINIDYLKTFLPDSYVSIEVKEEIAECIDKCIIKDDIISMVTTSKYNFLSLIIIFIKCSIEMKCTLSAYAFMKKPSRQPCRPRSSLL